MTPDCVAIVSGGMDSTTLLYFLVKGKQRRPVVLTLQYGQKHEREVDCARYHVEALSIEHHLVLDMNNLRPLFARSALVAGEVPIPQAEEVKGDPQPATYVPNRNMIFLALGVACAETYEVAEVFLGVQAHDIYGYWDTTPRFIELLNRVYFLNRKAPIKVKAPFVTFSKAELLELGLELGVDYGETWSCYGGGELACGRCPTCVERLRAFQAVGRDDPLVYQSFS